MRPKRTKGKVRAKKRGLRKSKLPKDVIRRKTLPGILQKRLEGGVKRGGGDTRILKGGGRGRLEKRGGRSLD